jgi:hypothetical protein
MKDTFYDRLDFYRLIESGNSDLEKMAEALTVDIKILRRWERSYDPGRGPFGAQTASSSPPRLDGKRGDILGAMHRTAMGGSVPAAKLMLEEYTEPAAPQEEVLTVEKAIALIREWRIRDGRPI